MRICIATLAVAPLIAILAPCLAWASPTQVDVRIEGQYETLFEGPILTEGHEIEASSDTSRRPCNGVDPNDAENLTPGATPTAASVDAMSIIGETFDGQWYPEYDDYLIERWGPEEQSPTAGAYWGVLVNNVLTSVGGCQYELSAGNEVLWVYNAFAHKPLLALYPAGYTAGARPLTATAELSRPFAVEVLAYDDAREGKPPAGPERAGSAPYAGADVSPVRTTTKGFEQVETEDPATARTDAQGKASITFTEPGWHRIKASAQSAAGEAQAIRSNRLDVCVPAAGSSDCPGLPPEDRVRTPPPAQAAGNAPEGEAQPPKTEASSPGERELSAGAGQAGSATGTGWDAAGPAEPVNPGVDPLDVQIARLDGRGRTRGLVGVSWQIAHAGLGLRSWTIASQTLGDTGAGYVGDTGAGYVGDTGAGKFGGAGAGKFGGAAAGKFGGAAAGKLGAASVGKLGGTGAGKLGAAGAGKLHAAAGYVTRATGTLATSALLALPTGAAYRLRITFTDMLGRESTVALGKVLVPRDDRADGLHYRGRWRHVALAGAWLDTVSRAGAGAQVSVRLGAGRPVFLLGALPHAARVEVLAGAHRQMFTVAAGVDGSPRPLTAAWRAHAGTVRLRVLSAKVDLDGVAVGP